TASKCKVFYVFPLKSLHFIFDKSSQNPCQIWNFCLFSKPYLTKEWYREAQLFAVNEYVDSRFLKENQNQLEKVSEGWYIWHGGYDMKTGIMDMDEKGD
ncbi:hypothetical protein, partial [Heyndrickxia coagulans]|uniref:hypothetical protein n=1 Tax=Heyndrickxia coagulans TaxID=1398 RepID=UPI003D2FC6C8